MKPYEQFKADFGAVCVARGGTFNERDTIGHGAAYHIPTRLGMLKASIHFDANDNERGRRNKIEGVYLRFDTYSTGKVYDALCGFDFNGYSGKWNIMASAPTLKEARKHCLEELELRLQMLAECEAVSIT